MTLAKSDGWADRYSFQFLPAPADLQPYLNSLYIWRCSETEFADILPAYSGQMALFVEGSARMVFDEGETDPQSGAFFLAPLCRARAFTVEGPAVLLGISLNFRGWAAFTNLSVQDNHDRYLEPSQAIGDRLGEEFAALAERWERGELDEHAILDAMADIVRRGLQPLPEDYQGLIDTTLDWLSTSFKPELDDLYERLPYSRRQAQRLVARFFGQSPIRLIRRYRAVRAATLLSLPDLPASVEAAIRDAFYDQAHMIRELQYFTGRTPRRLQPSKGSPINEMLGPGGYGSVDPFGADEGRQLQRADPLDA